MLVTFATDTLCTGANYHNYIPRYKIAGCYTNEGGGVG